MNEHDPSANQHHFLVLSGEGIEALTRDHVEALRITAAAMAGGRSVEAAVTVEAQSVDEAVTEAATTRRPEPCIDLTEMEPRAIVGLHQAISSGVAIEIDEQLEAGFGNGLAVLVDTDPPRAVAVFEALANSENQLSRRIAALEIPALVRVDQETALALWERLLQDEDVYTARMAAESMDSGYDDGKITLNQAARLARAYHLGPTSGKWPPRTA